MNEASAMLVRRAYANSSGGNSAELFRTVLSLTQEVGLDEVLACLEQCVIEKRLSWLDQQATALMRTGSPILDGYKLFYEHYLGLSIPRDGVMVEATESRWVTRWWNRCPTLEACCELGLDTREICRKVYHKPVQAFLERIDPRLRFARNYGALRPYAAYCEEIISLSERG
jgi:hypothetical protein